MKRILVIALIVSFGHASVALAGDTLLESARRVTRQVTKTQPPRHGNISEANHIRTDAGLQLAQARTGLSSSGLRKRTKVLLGLAVAVAFSGVVYAIDHKVEDSTPSSLGQR